MKPSPSRIMPKPMINLYLKYKFKYKDHSHKSYSQEGEDILLNLILDNNNGFYVDIGAHHPYKYSNTALLHKKGWSGINIDALPESIALFNKHRPNDKNLNVGIGAKEGLMTYYQFQDSAYNTFDKNQAESVISSGFQKEIKKLTKVPIRPLRDVLSQHQDCFERIDLLDIDVEGWDLECLRSNDWNRFRPKIILVEIFSTSVEQLLETETYLFLTNKNYKLNSKLRNSCIFVSN